jgi:hypothetical protein
MKIRFEQTAGILASVSLALLASSGWAQQQEQQVATAEQPTQQTATETNMQILRDKVRADKKALVAANLSLTDEQSAKFWPIYDEYQTDLQGLNQRLMSMIDTYAQNYGSMSDAMAKQLIDDSVSLAEDRAAMQKKYAKRLDGVIPAVEAARYLQIENKIRALVNYELASNIPLVE